MKTDPFSDDSDDKSSFSFFEGNVKDSEICVGMEIEIDESFLSKDEGSNENENEEKKTVVKSEVVERSKDENQSNRSNMAIITDETVIDLSSDVELDDLLPDIDEAFMKQLWYNKNLLGLENLFWKWV